MVEPGALVDLKVQAHELLFHNVQSLLSAEIRNCAPTESHSLREDVLGRFDVFRRGDLKNWMIGVDASYYSKHK